MWEPCFLKKNDVISNSSDKILKICLEVNVKIIHMHRSEDIKRSKDALVQIKTILEISHSNNDENPNSNQQKSIKISI